MVKQLSEENETKVGKAQKTTRLMMCLMNRVREMINAKLEEAHITIKQKESEFENLTKEKEDETAKIIA